MYKYTRLITISLSMILIFAMLLCVAVANIPGNVITLTSITPAIPKTFVATTDVKQVSNTNISSAPTQSKPISTASNYAVGEKKNLIWTEPRYVETNKKIMQQLFSGITGFIKLSDEERALVERHYTKKTSVYGEIPYDSLQVILDGEHFGPNDVVYDLGCGVGKVIVQIYLNTPVKKAVGIELCIRRYDGVAAMIKKFRQMDAYNERKCNGKMKREIAFKKGDFLKANLDDATIIYTCSTCFPVELMEEIVQKCRDINRLGLRVITLKELPDHETHGFRFERLYQLPMSWSKPGNTSNVYVYSYAGDTFK